MLCIDLQNRACIYYSLDSDGLVEGTTISASPEELPPGHARRPCPAVLGAMLHSSPASGVCSSELTLGELWFGLLVSPRKEHPKKKDPIR